LIYRDIGLVFYVGYVLKKGVNGYPHRHTDYHRVEYYTYLQHLHGKKKIYILKQYLRKSTENYYNNLVVSINLQKIKLISRQPATPASASVSPTRQLAAHDWVPTRPLHIWTHRVSWSPSAPPASAPARGRSDR
jgi:hypothetical protein